MRVRTEFCCGTREYCRSCLGENDCIDSLQRFVEGFDSAFVHLDARILPALRSRERRGGVSIRRRFDDADCGLALVPVEVDADDPREVQLVLLRPAARNFAEHGELVASGLVHRVLRLCSRVARVRRSAFRPWTRVVLARLGLEGDLVRSEGVQFGKVVLVPCGLGEHREDGPLAAAEVGDSADVLGAESLDARGPACEPQGRKKVRTPATRF